ncbi:hypothetical protein B0H15DRAFT_521945 [Mycena belliarum]|uniref:Uncharacterized protein n=1 Tax=Mycena belliarum TaxID=1033014 RepID=A0AAD6XLV9_9AGAR|nr:hypothetical protein B0H15DRAFT_521945 [Mycena belliae]
MRVFGSNDSLPMNHVRFIPRQLSHLGRTIGAMSSTPSTSHLCSIFTAVHSVRSPCPQPLSPVSCACPAFLLVKVIPTGYDPCEPTSDSVVYGDSPLSSTCQCMVIRYISLVLLLVQYLQLVLAGLALEALLAELRYLPSRRGYEFVMMHMLDQASSSRQVNVQTCQACGPSPPLPLNTDPPHTRSPLRPP